MKKYIIAVLALALVVALCVTFGASAFANNTVNSIEQREVPQLDEGGISFADGQNETVAISEEDYEFYGVSELPEQYEDVYQELLVTDTLDQVCDNIGEVLGTITDKYSAEDLVVRDLFAFELDDDSEAQKFLDADPENFIELNYAYNIKADDVFIVMQYIDGKWVALDKDHAFPTDGGVTIRITVDGLMAFVVVAK